MIHSQQRPSRPGVCVVNFCAAARAAARLLVLASLLASTMAVPIGAWAAPRSASSGKAAGSSGETAGPVDVNTASVDALVGLPGIGRATAQRIVDYRKEHGPFKSLDDLLNVRGIGEKSLARLKDRITIGSGGAKN